MGEPEGRTGQDRTPEGRPLPEGGSIVGEPTSSATQSQSLPPLRTGAQPAAGLDLLVEMDEPIELVIALRKIASERPGNQEWATVFFSMVELEKKLEKLQQPAAR